MPNDLSVSGLASIAASVVQTGRTTQSAATTLDTAAAPANGGVPLLNPALQIDPTLGMAVLEFRNAAGEVVNSIPSQRQLAAYLASGGAGSQTAPASSSAPGAATPPPLSA